MGIVKSIAHDKEAFRIKSKFGETMHQEAWNWLAKQIQPILQYSRYALDFGGADVNGTPRSLFSDRTEYVVLDTRAGINVEIVADATNWLPPRDYRSKFDVGLCTEVFEHVEHWRGILYNMWVTTKSVGTCLITCAIDPRTPHSILGVEPPPDNEWYRNVSLNEILPLMRFLFRDVQYTTHPRGDLYIRVVK